MYIAPNLGAVYAIVLTCYRVFGPSSLGFGTDTPVASVDNIQDGVRVIFPNSMSSRIRGRIEIF